MKHLFPINHFNILPDSKNLHFWYWGGFPYQVVFLEVVPLTFLLFFLKRNMLGLPRRFSLHIGKSNIPNHLCKYYRIVQPIHNLENVSFECVCILPPIVNLILCTEQLP